MANVFYIPSGPKQLATLFPSVNFDLVKNYYIEVTDGGTIATSPLMTMVCCPDGYVRLMFQTYSGGWDGATFIKPVIIHEDTASEFQSPLVYPLVKTDTGVERFNINSNDTYEAKLYCQEDDLPWLQELADSPKIFMQWEGTEGQADDYIPVVKIPGKFEKLKRIDEWRYEFVIQFKLSNTPITLRN